MLDTEVKVLKVEISLEPTQYNLLKYMLSTVSTKGNTSVFHLQIKQYENVTNLFTSLSFG